MSINHINGNGMPQMPGGAQITEMTPGADELGQKIVEAAQALVEVLGGENVHVSQSNGVGKAHGHKGPELSAPELDEADLEKAGKADLEAVVAFLQMKMDEKMAKVQGERLESLKGQLESAQKTQMEKINKSIEEARKQEAAAKAQKALGWLSAIIAVITAVVVTVCTGGLAAGFAIAGAALAVGSAIMNETGATKAICKSISKALQENNGMSKTTADAVSQAIYAGIELLFAAGCGFGGAMASRGLKAVEGATKLMRVAKAAQAVMKIASPCFKIGSTAVSGVNIAFNAKAGMAQADATESQKYLTKIQKMLEECQDDLEAMLDQLMQAGADTLALLESQTDTGNKITEEIGRLNA